MKLFLTSFDLKPLPNFIGKDPHNTTIGFIPTAADLYEDKWFVEKDRKFFVDNGYKVTDVDIKDRS